MSDTSIASNRKFFGLRHNWWSILVLLILSILLFMLLFISNKSTKSNGTDESAANLTQFLGHSDDNGFYDLDIESDFITNSGKNIQTKDDLTDLVNRDNYGDTISYIKAKISKEEYSRLQLENELNSLAKLCHINVIPRCIDDLIPIFENANINTIDLLNYQSFLDQFRVDV